MLPQLSYSLKRGEESKEVAIQQLRFQKIHPTHNIILPKSPKEPDDSLDIDYDDSRIDLKIPLLPIDELDVQSKALVNNDAIQMFALINERK